MFRADSVVNSIAPIAYFKGKVVLLAITTESTLTPSLQNNITWDTIPKGATGIGETARNTHPGSGMMLNQASQTEPRILLTGIQELDQLARRFRRRLRDVAVQLSQETGHLTPIGPDIILRAAPIACRELLSDLGSDFGDERVSDGRKKEAA